MLKNTLISQGFAFAKFPFLKSSHTMHWKTQIQNRIFQGAQKCTKMFLNYSEKKKSNESEINLNLCPYFLVCRNFKRLKQQNKLDSPKKVEEQIKRQDLENTKQNLQGIIF